MALKPIKEKILYIKLRQKDKEAFMKAYDAYIDDIYRFIFFKLNNNQAESEDLTSQVFLKSWSHIQNNSLKDYRTLKALFYKIARNLVIDYYRNSKQETVSIDEAESNIEIADEEPSIIDQIDREIARERLEQAMLELKSEYREALMLRYINDLSIKEMAEILDKSAGNIRVLLYRASQAMKEILEKEGRK